MWENRGLDLFEKDREYIVFYGVFSIFFGGRLGLDLFRKDRESEKIGVSIFSEKIENLKNRGRSVTTMCETHEHLDRMLP